MSVVRIVAEESLVKVVEENQHLVVVQGAFDPNYGSFYDTTTQAFAGGSSAQAMRFNTTDLTRYVEMVDGHKIWIRKPGKYNIQFSAQFEKSTGGSHIVDIWLARNGVNEPHTNSTVVITDGAGIGSRHVAAWNFFVDSEAGDEFELMWFTDTAAMNLLAHAAQTSPARPAIPSVILTVNQIG